MTGLSGVSLKKIMEKMGFGARWVNLVMGCISTMSYSILVNGEPKGEIKPSKGIRQGDPLSPYLFLLCSKGFNRLIQGVVREDKIRGNGPRISHLFFANNTLIFCRVEMGDLLELQDILNLYEKASSQQTNRGKTTIFFSKAVSVERKVELSNFLGVSEVKEYEKYLGLPAVVGRNKRASLNYIKERVWNKLQG